MSLPRLLRRRPWASALLACALIAPAVYALTPASDAAPASSPTHPPLWKVSDKDNSLYLLGSFHLLKTSDYPLSQDVEAAFADAESLVFEVTPAELADPANAAKMQAAAGYSGDQRLSTVLPADVRDKLVARMGEAAFAQLDPYEPWFINLQMLLATASQMGFQFDKGLDNHLMQRAAQAGKPTSGLEGIESQFKVMESAPMSEQVAGLKDLVDNPAEMPRMLNQMHGAWRSSDDATLTALMLKEMREKTPVSYRLMNVQRNDAWLPKLRLLLDKGGKDDALVVVGTLHLLGEDGLVRKLRASGYTVERICTGCGGSKR
ncbi:TraB/GumN family protein [Agrilutibacter solisilvae]|uniref:TraB/GumN family protein n=1 Tax=Agrilutibacter solisilvae TaxID=2763317 RepID=A0A974Y3U8_9GAMM|nr:TraB/GumN family protein [Lysobacter solisilvae]QSX77341.1 TraB/GumN family protein [Lysobacter solisilvae]